MTFPPGQRHPDDRIDQYCDSCRQYDRHPRHIMLWDDGRITYKHMDCCAQDGCPAEEPRPGQPDARCHVILRDSGQAHGDDLTRFLRSRMPAEESA